MNKKSAFTVAAQSLRKMEFETANRSISVMPVEGNLQEETDLIPMISGLNIKKANRPTNSQPKSINVPQGQFNERQINMKLLFQENTQGKL